jgi:hypothetical protein
MKGLNMKKEDSILFSGGIKGAEAEFGVNAERLGIEEVNFTFDGHSIIRKRGLRVLNHEELKNGDVSLEYISQLMKPLYVFDQKRNAWFMWKQLDWVECKKGSEPVISHVHFTGTGTRFLEENGRKAIAELFERSFA